MDKAFCSSRTGAWPLRALSGQDRADRLELWRAALGTIVLSIDRSQCSLGTNRRAVRKRRKGGGISRTDFNSLEEDDCCRSVSTQGQGSLGWFAAVPPT